MTSRTPAIALLAAVLGTLSIAASAHASLEIGNPQEPVVGTNWVDQIALGIYGNGGSQYGNVTMWPYGQDVNSNLNYWEAQFNGLRPACSSSTGWPDDVSLTPSDVTTGGYTVSPDSSSAELSITGSVYAPSCGDAEPFVLDVTMAGSGAPRLVKLPDPYGWCADLGSASSCMSVNRTMTTGTATFAWCVFLDPDTGECVAPDTPTVMNLNTTYSGQNGENVITTEVVSMSDANPTLTAAYDDAMTFIRNSVRKPPQVPQIPSLCGPPGPAC